jgi:2-methylcitrate dehydratase PrpD
LTSIARRIAGFALGMKLESVPQPVVANGVDLILDTLGNALAAAHDDFGLAVLDVARGLGGTPESTLICGAGGGGRLSARVSAPSKVDGLVANLGRKWEVAELTLKPYPCGSIAQPYMDCAMRLRAQHGVRAEHIKAILCRTSAGPLPRLWEPLAAKHAPPNGYAAKFSLPDVLRVTRLVNYEIDPTIDYPRQFVGDVEVTLADGRTIRERQDRPRGGPDAPLTRAEFEAKFRGNAALALPEARVERLIRNVYELTGGAPLDGVLSAMENN